MSFPAFCSSCLPRSNFVKLRKAELTLNLEISTTDPLPADPALLLGIGHLLTEHVLSYVNLPNGLSDLLLRHVHHIQAIIKM